MADILNYKKDGLKIFESGVLVNRDLPKWKNANVKTTKSGNMFIVPQTQFVNGEEHRIVDLGTTNSSTNTVTIINNGGWVDASEPANNPEKLELSAIASMGLRELNEYVDREGLLYNVLSVTGRFVTANESYVSYGTEPKKELTFKDKLKLLFKKTEKPEMDVVAFFANIKATSKESAKGYVNRVEKYLAAIHNAKTVGQTALSEKLMREMIANKYESFLAAEGYYYVVTEQQVIDFAKKSERGISLDYLKNFVRPIPDSVIKKINKADELEVFDNYVIMHYDPKGEARQDTAKEEIKKRDPIVFGVIAGSTKLYYVADWIDEYCDLTLEKFVDTLKITKDDLVQDEEEKTRLETARAAAKAEKEKAKKDPKPKATKKATPKKKEEPKVEEEKPKKKTTRKKKEDKE